jgi:uncharacterized membrane protein
MAKQKQNFPQNHTPNPVAAAAAQSRPYQQPMVVTTELQQYSGQIPPPALLRDFDTLVPGTAARLIQWAEDEQLHRRRLESDAQAANINAQQRQLAMNEYQSRSVFRSDMFGQALGFLVCAMCVAGAVWLGLAGQTASAVALAAIPTGAVLLAFRNNVFGKKPQANNGP